MRRRADKPTVRLERVPTMNEIAASWHAALNDSAIAASSERENGHRETTAVNLQPEG